MTARAACPQGRAGLAPATERELRDTVTRFQAWLRAERKARLTTGALDVRTIERFLADLGATPQTRNKHARNLRCAVYWIADLRPARFPDIAGLRKAFKPVKTDPPEPACLAPQELRALLATALEREQGYTVEVERMKGGKVERFEQGPAAFPSVPLSRLLLLLALTGARRGEVLALKWEDVDLDRGRLLLRATKTGKRRLLPLTGAPEAEVAPRLRALLRRWRLEERAAGVSARPQAMRQTFCSVAASLGIPASVAAGWQGHGAAIAERWYRSLAPERMKNARDFEEALGLAPLLDQMLGAGEERQGEASLA